MMGHCTSDTLLGNHPWQQKVSWCWCCAYVWVFTDCERQQCREYDSKFVWRRTLLGWREGALMTAGVCEHQQEVQLTTPPLACILPLILTLHRWQHMRLHFLMVILKHICNRGPFIGILRYKLQWVELYFLSQHSTFMTDLFHQKTILLFKRKTVATQTCFV